MEDLAKRVKALQGYFFRTDLAVSWRLQEGGREGRGTAVPYIEVDEYRRVLNEAVLRGVILDWTARYEPLGSFESLRPRRGQAEGREGASSLTYMVRCVLEVVLPSDDGNTYRMRREDIGAGADLKAAFSDALKRAAANFGIGAFMAELQATSVEVDRYGRIAERDRERLDRITEEAIARFRRQLSQLDPTAIELGNPGGGGRGVAETGRTSLRPPEGDAPEAPRKLPARPQAQAKAEASPAVAATAERTDHEEGALDLKTLVAHYAKSDEVIARKIDDLKAAGRGKEVAELIRRYRWQRGLFQEATESLDLGRVARFLSTFLDQSVEADEESVRQALVEAKGLVKALYNDLKALG